MESALLTDYYQLTMAETYLKKGLTKRASFELFIRRLPRVRNFLVSAGLSQALSFLKSLSFSDDDLSYLKSLGFSNILLDYLKDLRFKGTVYALPEGTIFFENEPIIRIEAELPLAQLVETRLINIFQFQTLVASKAVRCVLAAKERPIVDFGLRRAHEFSAGLLAARATYISGFSGTSVVLAGRLFNIPVTGTMAHSFILAHEREEQAFRNFIETHPDAPILLIDTYNTLKAAETVSRIHPEYLKKGIKIRGVRIDSGDLLELSRQVRNIFDKRGLKELLIFCSGGLDEYKIKWLMEKGAPIDGFGVGTSVTTSSDAPYLDCAYKLVEYDGRPCMKFSEGKITLPFKKQVFRRFDEKRGHYEGDTIAIYGENVPGRPLLKRVMEDGNIIFDEKDNLEVIRERLREELKRFPLEMRSITERFSYRLEVSKGIKEFDLKRGDQS